MRCSSGGCGGGGGCGAPGVPTGGVRDGAAMERGVLPPVNFSHQPLHLVQGAVQHQDVVPGEKQRSDLGQLPHRGPVRVGHHLAQAVHGQVEVMHPLPLTAVNLESELVHFLLGDLFLHLKLVAVTVPAAQHLSGLVSAAQLLPLLLSAVRGRRHGGAAVVVVVVVVTVMVVSEKDIVHVRGGCSTARAGV